MNDLISRQALLESIERISVKGNVLDDDWVYIFIQEFPSAQPETPSYLAEIESEYKKWISMPHINKPLAKALYEVWKKHDREDVSRNG